MKLIYQYTAISFIIAFALVGCNDENKNEKKGSVSQPQVQLQQKEIIINEHNMVQHLSEFQSIAMQNGGNRAVGSAGGQASAKYIIDQANKAGFRYQATEFKTEENQTGKNIVVEIPGKLNGSVVLIGAHYDSVKEGPGINDNASGVSVLLELMTQFSQKKIQPNHTIRLAFWDAEETGLEGAKAYVSKLSEAQLKQINTYINVDMIGARNPIAMLPKVDKAAMLKEEEEKLRNSARQGNQMTEDEIQAFLDKIREIPTHPNDLAINKSLEAFLKSQKLMVEKTLVVNTRTDMAAFAGKVPVTGFVFRSSAPGEEEFIPCYHKLCDTRELIDPKSLGISGKAVVHLLKNLKTLS